MIRIFFLLLCQILLFAADFDCIVVGTSPFSLFEALYQNHLGKKVLIVEADSLCGGAWRSIDICGVCHADLGCHQVGSDLKLKEFLEEYAGCKIVSMDHPLEPFLQSKSPNGWYFSQGCFELIDHLLQLIRASGIPLLTQCKVENVTIDLSEKTAQVYTQCGLYTTAKMIITPMSCFTLNPTPTPQNYAKAKHYHLYLLIQDATPPKFSYHHGVMSGVSRMMNLTHFVNLDHSGRQLIVIQTHNEQTFSQTESILNALKREKMVDASAYILKAEPYIYETGTFHQALIKQMGAEGIVEMLQTGHFANLSNYIPKWKTALKPYKEIIQ